MYADMPVELSFSGYLTFEWADLKEMQSGILKNLRDWSHLIAREIADRISDSIQSGAPPEVYIHFNEGSLIWHGVVQFARESWPAIEAMSTVGGAIALMQIVKNAVDGVLRERLSKIMGPRITLYPSSQVSLQNRPTGSSRRLGGVQSNLLGFAALIASVAALIAALAWLIRVLNH